MVHDADMKIVSSWSASFVINILIAFDASVRILRTFPLNIYKLFTAISVKECSLQGLTLWRREFEDETQLSLLLLHMMMYEVLN